MIVPDPGLTLSETLNVMGLIHLRMGQEADAVLESAWDKLRQVATHAAEHDPEEFARVRAEIDMARRFGLGRS